MLNTFNNPLKEIVMLLLVDYFESNGSYVSCLMIDVFIQV
ncbi:hypothetical protein CUZ89_2513 [Enterococcus xinjiangensis]|nr:hypothetical protein [Enterococcus lactis]